jgi:hypothetical protein
MLRSLLMSTLALLMTVGPAMADCGYKSKDECNSYGNDADDYGGCSVETSNAWFDIKIRSGRVSATKICEKYPPDGYCGCDDYGIY